MKIVSFGGGKNRGHALDCPIVVVSSVSRISQGLSSLYIYMNKCIQLQQDNKRVKTRPRCPRRVSPVLCRGVYNEKYVIQVIYIIIIYGLSKLTVVTGLPFAVSVSKNGKTNDTCRGERASLLSPLSTSQPSVRTSFTSTRPTVRHHRRRLVTYLYIFIIISKGTRVIVLYYYYYYNDFCIFFFLEYLHNVRTIYINIIL